MPKSSIEIAQDLMFHAVNHYEDGGWDVIVECSTIPDLVIEVQKHGWTNSDDAIEWYQTGPVAVWADQQADAVTYKEEW